MLNAKPRFWKECSFLEKYAVNLPLLYSILFKYMYSGHQTCRLPSL